MDDLAAQIWRLEKVVVLGEVASGAPLSPLTDSVEHALLEFVRDTPGAYPAQVADALAVTRAAVTKRLRALVSRDLVALEPDPLDGRRLLVELTRRGTALLEEQEQLRSHNAERYVAAWPADDAARLLELLTHLNDEIARVHERHQAGWARARD